MEFVGVMNDESIQTLEHMGNFGDIKKIKVKFLSSSLNPAKIEAIGVNSTIIKVPQ
ncbi:hypothetical protein [Priestia megaterium]|uniref:hypothetical protein n=1 Tax=Priestia megaterium TaxID=1404 RepID=UPI0025A4A0C3|nr:hypothetical protein [Priestia megaterium]MDM8151313.1 hypothetical protein [Priestia megaterium]